MSLHDDFGMYYNGTFIGYRNNDGTVSPFLVEAVSNDSDMFNLRNYPSSQRQSAEHGEDAYNALVFHGRVINGSRRGGGRQVSMVDDKLIFELPDPKYIKFDNQYYWVSYRANRSTKKGMCSRRINCRLSFTDTVAVLMFGTTEDPNILGCFLRKGENLDYKGTPVGQITGNNVMLFREAGHLSRLLKQEWPECQVTVEGAEQAPQT